MKSNSKIIIIFELFILTISLVFFKYIKVPLLPQNISLSLLIGIGTGILLFIVTNAFREKSKSILRNIYEYHEHHINKTLFHNLTYYPIIIVLSEELFFRGLIYSLFGFWITNIAFALVHTFHYTDKLVTFISIFLYGLVFSLTLWITGSLLAPIVTHYIFTILRIYFFTKFFQEKKKLYKKLLKFK